MKISHSCRNNTTTNPPPRWRVERRPPACHCLSLRAGARFPQFERERRHGATGNRKPEFCAQQAMQRMVCCVAEREAHTHHIRPLHPSSSRLESARYNKPSTKTARHDTKSTQGSLPSTPKAIYFLGKQIRPGMFSTVCWDVTS